MSSISSDTVADVLAVCVGAYSIRTTKGYAADLGIFGNWCSHRRADWLPADPATVAAVVDDQVARYRISTIKRRLCAIAFAHRMRDLPTPTDTNVVRIAVRRASRQRASRPHQKRGLTHDIKSVIVAACPASLAGLRDSAIISVGYDTLCRSSELSEMLVEHLELKEDGSGCILIPRTKADVAGEGRLAHLSPDTVKLLRGWINATEMTSGPLFRSLHLHRIATSRLCTSSIRRLIKRATDRAGLDPDLIIGLSGHSMRIGAAQDMLVAGFDTLSIMQAGGWKSPNVVLRYVEKAGTFDLHQRRWDRLRGKKR